MCNQGDNYFVEYLQVDVSVIDWGVGRVTITDANDTNRWTVNKAGMLDENKLKPDGMLLLESLGFEYQTDPFNFRFRRDVSDDVYFDNYKRSIIFMNKYLEIGFTLPTQDLVGIGQQNRDLEIKEGNYTVFNRDQPGSPEAMGDGNSHLYGSHPFIMGRAKGDRFFGMLFYNSNAQQF